MSQSFLFKAVVLNKLSKKTFKNEKGELMSQSFLFKAVVLNNKLEEYREELNMGNIVSILSIQGSGSKYQRVYCH